MHEIAQLLFKISDLDTPDFAVCQASDRLAHVIESTMRGPSSLRDKIECCRVCVQMDWTALLPRYLTILAQEVGP